VTELHPTLRRMLKRRGLTEGEAPSAAQWAGFLEGLSAYYGDLDADRYTIERAFTISSNEMKQLYERLKQSSENQIARQRDELEHSLAIVRAALDTMLDGVLVVDTDWRHLTHNRRFTEMWQLPAAFERDHDGDRINHIAAMVEDPHSLRERVLRHAAAPSDLNRIELRLKDGRLFDRFIAPIVGPSGGLFGHLLLFRDITEERAGQEAIARLNGFLDSIVENLPHMIFVKDARTLEFVRFNRAGEELLGLSRDALIGRSDLDLFPPEQAEFFTRIDRDVLAGGCLIDIPEERIQTGQGERILHTKKIPIHDQAGQPAFLLGISHDITDKKRQEESLRAALELAETASRAKTEFLSNMSHEMRTPLNAIVGFSRVLAGDESGLADPARREYVGYIQQAGEHMLTLVNDLLDLRRIEEKRQSFHFDIHDVAPLVSAAVSMVRPLLDERGHEFRLAVPAGRLRCDARAVVQILINLLSNAAKYTPPGGQVELRADLGSDQICFEVIDTGVGIDPDQQGMLFTYFTQVGARHRLGMQGSGVGLALTRSLVEGMGGHIDFNSEPGAGSTFRVRLPADGACADGGG
jgi:PAS domain S-box-containing protein